MPERNSGGSAEETGRPREHTQAPKMVGTPAGGHPIDPLLSIASLIAVIGASIAWAHPATSYDHIFPVVIFLGLSMAGLFGFPIAEAIYEGLSSKWNA